VEQLEAIRLQPIARNASWMSSRVRARSCARAFVDPATEGLSSNEYFEANEQCSMGLPTRAGAAT